MGEIDCRALRDVGQLRRQSINSHVSSQLAGQGSLRIGPQDRTDSPCKCTETGEIDCGESQLDGQGFGLLGPQDRTDLPCKRTEMGKIDYREFRLDVSQMRSRDVGQLRRHSM